MDIATKPDAEVRVRSKRSPTTRQAREHRPVGNGSGVAAVDAARGSVEQLEQLLARAEEHLNAANLRLIDADAARRHLLGNVASGGDEARRRFAGVLQDDVLQQLTAAELQLERIRTDARRTRYASSLDQLGATMKQVEESLRGLLYNVSPASSDLHVRLPDAIRDRLAALKAHTGIEPDLDVRLPKRIHEAVRSIVYRNLAEAISNVEKHANATRISIKVEAVGGGIQGVVADDGTGFLVTESLFLPGHLGLVAMRERAQLGGGWCRFESEPGAGTRVTFWVPNNQ